MTDNIIIKDIVLHYKVTGKGADVILLHGWGCTHDIFRSLHAALEKNFKVYALDFPGFGESTVPPVVWGVEDYTRMLEIFIREQGIENPILLGHSFGGRVALLYSSRNPVRKVILADAAGIRPRRSVEYYVKVYSYKLYKKILPLLVGRKKAEQQLEAYRKKAGSEDYRNVSGMMRNIFVKVVNEDLRHVMPRIAAPVLLIWGENDTATPVGDAKMMNKRIKDSGLVVFKNAGHYSFLDKPYDFMAVIDSFLSDDRVTGNEK